MKVFSTNQHTKLRTILSFFKMSVLDIEGFVLHNQSSQLCHFGEGASYAVFGTVVPFVSLLVV